MKTAFKIQQLPLESLVKSEVGYLNEFGANKEVLVKELRRFLTLITETKETLAPSKAVDALYHELLENQNLRHKVENALGGVLEHDPTISGKTLERMYERTKLLYENRFGMFNSFGINAKGISASCCGTGLKPYITN